MGEAKRRKQILGDSYAKPLGLDELTRRELIRKNLESLFSEFTIEIGYPDVCEQPCGMEFESVPGGVDMEDILNSVIEHWQTTFNGEVSTSSLKVLVTAARENRPIFLTGEAEQSGSLPAHEPVMALPNARKYFQGLLALKEINLDQHYILIKDVLAVMAEPSNRPLIRQLILTEFTDVLIAAEENNLPWFTKNIGSDGYINMTKRVFFEGFNQALIGVLTMIVTLPWEKKLSSLR